MRYIYLGDLPHLLVSQPESSTYNIVLTHHELMSSVLVMTVEKVVMILYGHTALSALHSHDVSN